ncbi:hypothetical protein OIU78_013474 [Salix suchowensis]|nr:hypothetical protein OIU78_013474 [Salix suchowensis]
MLLKLHSISKGCRIVVLGQMKLHLLLFLLLVVIRVWSQRAAIFGDDECEHGAVPTVDHYDFMDYCKGFIVGEKNHPKTEDFYSKLEALSDSVTKEETELLTEAVSDSFPERKEQPLFRNLRACEDCHDFGKQVSSITGREIIVRDSSDSITSSQGNVLAMTTGDPTQRCITADSFVS